MAITDVKKQPKTVWVATVDLHYQVIAVGETEYKARHAALSLAAKDCRTRPEHGILTKKHVENWFGCTVYEVPMNGAIQQ